MLKSLRGLLNDHLFDDNFPSDRSSRQLQHPGYIALVVFGSFGLIGGVVSALRPHPEYARPVGKETAYVVPPIQLENNNPYLARDKR